jgi:hypothetical protein
MSANDFTYNSIVKIKRAYSLILLCFLSIFVSNCSRSSSLKGKERVMLTKFFEELLLAHGGAYTLLGSKPVTVEDLIDMSPEHYKKVQEYLAAHPEIPTIEIDRHLEEGWAILKKNPILFSNRFILTEVNSGNYDLLVFLNKESAIQSMKEHYSEFERVFGSDFDPIAEIENLRLGKHDLWRRVFSDFICQGILLGYGLENARLFEKLYSERVNGDLQEEYQASENADPRIKADCYLNEIPFRIPIFVMFDKSESEALVSKYKNERERIRKIYAEKSFLDTTLSMLKK